MCIKVHTVVIHERDSFTFEAFLHDVRGLEMTTACEFTVPIDDPMTGEIGAHCFVERPPNGSRRPSTPKVLGNVAVRGDPPWRDLRHHGPDSLEEGR